MTDFPNQTTACGVAREVLERLFEERAPRQHASADEPVLSKKAMNRRDFLSAMRTL